MGLVDLLIKNGLVLTMDKDRRIITEGTVTVEEGRIISVKRGWTGRGKPEEVIDARGKIVMPGFVCSYTSLHGLFLLGTRAKMGSFSDLSQLQQQVYWPVEEAMTKEDVYAVVLYSCLRFLKTGVTSFAGTISAPNAIAGILDKVSLAVERSRIRGMIAFEATERRTRAEGAKATRENERFIKKMKKERTRRVRGMFGIGPSSLVSDELLWHVKELVNRYKTFATVVTSKGLSDVHRSYERFGKRTVERLNDLGLLSPETVLVHSIHVNEGELGLIKKRGAKVVHSPMEEMLDGVGATPVMKMTSSDISVGVGDGGYSFDWFENIRTAYLLQKVVTHGPDALTPMEVLEMATIKGAELYGLQNEVGSIEHGKLADIIIVNPGHSPVPLRSDNVVDHVVNAVSGRNVETVLVGGNVVMSNREVQTVDEMEAAKQVKRSVERIWQKLGLGGGR